MNVSIVQLRVCCAAKALRYSRHSILNDIWSSHWKLLLIITETRVDRSWVVGFRIDSAQIDGLLFWNSQQAFRHSTLPTGTETQLRTRQCGDLLISAGSIAFLLQFPDSASLLREPVLWLVYRNSCQLLSVDLTPHCRRSDMKTSLVLVFSQ